MYHGRDTGAYQLNAFIARRTEMMLRRRFHADQYQFRRWTGAAFRLHGAAAGGRMLSYTPVTNLVRYTDVPSSAE
jgi:hypothetical protein